MTDKPDQNDRQLLEQALEFVKANHSGGPDAYELMDAIRARLEQPEQEPVATDDLPKGFIPLQQVNGQLVYAACMDFNARHYKWLMRKHPAGHWVSERKLEDWEVMQVEDQDHYGIIQEAEITPPAAPVQEPVSDAEIEVWAERHDIQGTPTDLRCMFEDAASFNTPPAAQRQWVGLTEDDIRPLCKQTWVFDTVKQWAEIIEAKLKEKNT